MGAMRFCRRQILTGVTVSNDVPSIQKSREARFSNWHFGGKNCTFPCAIFLGSFRTIPDWQTCRAWIQREFAKPTTTRSITIATKAPSQFVATFIGDGGSATGSRGKR
jgi:hypothetical protein